MFIPRERLVTAQTKLFHDLGIRLSKIQMRFLTSLARNLIWISGTRSGKSWLPGGICATELMFPDRHIWIVGPSYDLARREFDHCYDFLCKIKFRDNKERLVNYIDVSRPKEGSCKIITQWGSWVETKTTEQNVRSSSNLLGVELDLLILAEAGCHTSEPFRRYLVQRLGSRRGRLIAASTGAGDIGLFYELVEEAEENIKEFGPAIEMNPFFDKKVKSGGDWTLIRSNTIEANPTFSKEEYELRRKTLDKKIFEEQFEGKLVSRRGKVFDLPDNAKVTLTTKEKEDLKLKTIFIGLKYDYTNGLAMVAVAYDRLQKTYTVFKDLFKKHVQLEEHVKEFVDSLKGYRFSGIIADSWNKDCVAQIEKLGISVTVNDECKEGKVSATLKRLRLLRNTLAQNKVRFSSEVEGTLDEFNLCKWPDQKKEGSDLLDNNLPLPKFFQLLECISYVILFLDGG